MADYYSLLGVAKGASSDEIKRSYRKLAMQYHPDRNPGDKAAEDKFKELTAAYEVLMDDEKRALYDRYGEAAFQPGTGGGGGHGGFDFRGSGAGAFADIFEDLFGMAGGRGGNSQARAEAATRGSDLRYNMEITLEEAFFGEKKQIKLNALATCDTCTGSGSADSSGASECGTCHGHGRVRMQQGFFTMERTCHSCNGTGQLIKNPCKTCHGEGRMKKTRTLAVDIPKGIEEGTRIRLNGEGEAGIRGGKSGDLYIFIGIKPHELFTRDGSDLHCVVPITFTKAALGGAFEIPTLEGTRAKVSVPAGTQNNNKFRLKGKGMPVMRTSRFGDLYVHTKIEVPVKLTERQEALLREFEELHHEGETPETDSFLTKVKKFFE